MRATCTAVLTAGVMCGAAAAQVSPFLPGDLVYGPSVGSAGIEQVRDGQFIGANDTLTFAQSVTFDNAGGFPSNARGNLLGANFGTTMGGGSLYNFATDGTANATVLYQFNGTGIGSTTLGRVGGVSVSPNNALIALFSTSGAIVFLEFNDGGPNAGDGLSASVVDAWEAGSVLTSTSTQGTAWVDNSTLAVAVIDNNVLKIRTIDGIDPASNSFAGTTIRIGDFPALIGVPFASSNHTAIAYNPAVNPFMYVASSTFDGTLGGQSMVTVVDPATWTLVGEISLNNSMETAREIALSADGRRLFLAQFPFESTGGGLQDMSVDVLDLDVDGNMTVNAADISAIPADSSEDFYLGRNNNSFVGIAVAHTASVAASTGGCCTATVSSGCFRAESADCAARGGVFQGVGVDCGTVNCAPVTGACCIAGVCTVETASACADQGGLYQGDNTTCAEIACPVPERSGACCTDGVCSVMTSSDCTAQGGVYMGDGVACGSCDLGEQITIFDFDANVVGGRNLSFTLTPDLSATGYTFPNSVFDVFGPVDRTVNNAFADDSLSVSDFLGLLPSTKTDMVFGILDPNNPDNPSPGTISAQWTFDISGYSDVRVVMEIAAMGDFEATGTTADRFDFTASIDGGPAVPVYTSAVDEAITALYTMESGILRQENDPVMFNGTLVLNRFVRLAGPTLGSGATLTLTLNGQGDGGDEPVAFDNIVLLGSTGGATCVCETDGNAAQVNVFDLLAYLDLWFPSGPGADIDGTPGVNVFDLLFFLDCWFPASAGAPCP